MGERGGMGPFAPPRATGDAGGRVGFFSCGHASANGKVGANSFLSHREKISEVSFCTCGLQGLGGGPGP